jgi:hypothetical protein
MVIRSVDTAMKDQADNKRKVKKPRFYICKDKKATKEKLYSSIKQSLCLRSLLSPALHRQYQYRLNTRQYSNPDSTHMCLNHLTAHPLVTAITHFKTAHDIAVGEHIATFRQMKTQLTEIITAADPPKFLQKFQKSLDVRLTV